MRSKQNSNSFLSRGAWNITPQFLLLADRVVLFDKLVGVQKLAGIEKLVEKFAVPHGDKLVGSFGGMKVFDRVAYIYLKNRSYKLNLN